MNANDHPSPSSALTPNARPARSQLVIVEPDRLTRWSLSAYLACAFEVSTAASASEAHDILGSTRVDAIVISDDLEDNGADRVEAFARLQNANVAVVRTVTARPDTVSPDRVCLEKPFNLSALAKLLGVASQRTSGRSR